MEIYSTIKLAISELKRNKSRSFLTILGIIIGVFAVITLVSVGVGLKGYIVQQFESLGSNLLYIMPGKIGSEEGGLGGSHGAPNFAGSKLKLTMVKSLQKIGDPVVEVAGDIEIPADAKYKNKQKRTTVIGGNELLLRMLSLKVKSGRFFNNSEISGERRVAVIGPELKSKLFENENPLGKEITISETKVKVIGVMETRGAGFMGGMADNTAYLPITTSQRLFGVENLQTIIVSFSDKSRLEEAKNKIKAVLSKELKEDDFSLLNQSSILSTINSILNILTLALAGIAAISLLVGGIGIMNIMLVSVTERIKEIGIRKAVGAKNKDILSQFIIEAIFLSLFGGIIGSILGIFGSLIIGKLISANALAWWSILLALGVCCLVGIVFGVVPAARAAKLDPVDALRYE